MLATLRDRRLAWRNALLASPRFQRFASRFPLTRGIARRRATALFDLTAGFVYSQVLFACVELKIFDLLAAGPMAAGDIAERVRLPLEAGRRLFEAAAGLRLLERRGETYALGIHGAAFLGNPSVGAMVEHHAMLYRDLADPVSLLRGGRATELGRFWSYATASEPANLGEAETAPYTALMAASQALVADDILDAYPFVDHEVLLDVGGGSGAFLLAAAERRPDLRLVLFDLPPVAAAAAVRFADAGLGARARTVGGDFSRDPLPKGADLVSLVRVAHDHDDATVAALFKSIYEALPSGGLLLLAEPMAETAGAETVGTYFSFYLFAMQRGRPRSADELSRMLSAAGFSRVRCIATARPMLVSLLLAQKDEA